MFREFKTFASNGSAAEMGIGIVLGAAFSKVVDSLVSDILLPPIGFAFSKVNIAGLYIPLSGGYFGSLKNAQEAGVPTINYGLFIMNIIHFVVIMFAVFIVVRQMNRIRNPNDSPMTSLEKKECPYCFSKISPQARRCPNCTSDLNTDYKKLQTLTKIKVSKRI